MTSQAMTETDELARVLNAAVRAALAFRQELPDGLQKPTANYAVMREAFDGPLLE
jgi:hypothetical protein